MQPHSYELLAREEVALRAALEAFRHGYLKSWSRRVPGAAPRGCQAWFSKMNDNSPRRHGTTEAQETSRSLAALSSVAFGQGDPAAILREATAAFASLGPCRVEATFHNVNGAFVLWPPSQTERPDIEQSIRTSGCDGRVELPDRPWGWAFPLSHQTIVNGCIVLSAANQPGNDQILLLTVLAQQTGAALANAALHDRDAAYANRLTETNTQLEGTNRELADALQGLQRQANVQEVMGAAVAADLGEQGIVDALHELTAFPVALEDRFGNLRCWAGPGRPDRYPKQTSDRRELLLHRLAVHDGPVRVGERVLTLVKPRAEVLGVLAFVDPNTRLSDHDLFAVRYGSTVLGLELSHQRSLAEIELNLRRELVDDLLAGTDQEGAYARAEALGHDLRLPHWVVVVQSARRADSTVVAAAGRAATALQLNYLQGRHAGLVVLLLDGRPDPRALHRVISQKLGSATTVIGIGSRCETPLDFPQSFAAARRALNIRLNSATPEGASAYDELGFYRLVDAAHRDGAVEDFVREWLGVLLDYDKTKNSELVHTLSEYLEYGGSYDESAAALHIHRSTLRYRLARIRELTGFDLRDVNTRFNLHAATRAWRFLNPDG
jgi:hypothetical protein